MRALPLVLLCAAVAADPEKSRARARAFEAELAETIARVAPAVGAVTCHRVVVDPATGRLAVVPYGVGSGVVIAREGWFLTNVHVVEHAIRITVALPDGVVREARLHADTSGERVKGDIALLKLEGEAFPFVDWQRGEPSKLLPGDFVFALGNPHHHAADGQPVATLGIVSGKGRAAAEGTGFIYLDVLQTDAEINPGNSGGPLFDAWGRLVGINGLMASRQGRSNSGVGWAIPVDQIRLFLKDLMRGSGEGVAYGYHGLHVDSAPDDSGAVVVGVEAGSPAARAGLVRGHVLVIVNGKKVRNRTEFVNLVGRLPERSLVRVSYRDGRTLRTAQFRLANFDALRRSDGGDAREGGGVRKPLPFERRGYLGVEWEGGPEGLRVTKLVPGGPAETGGLRAGDVILGVLGTRVREGKTLLDALSGFEPGEAVEVRYSRDGREGAVTIELAEALAVAR